MRLKPHTYRRLAWVACWTAPVKDPDILFCFEKLRPAEDELQCLNNLLSLYKTLLERYPDVDFTVKTTNGLECWKNLRKDEDGSIQTLTILFPTPRSLATFLRQFHDIFYISEIAKYCADGPVDSYKWHLLAGMLSCFGGPSRSFSSSLSDCLANFYYSWCVNKHNFQSDEAHAMEYCDLYRDLYSNEFPVCPEEPEVRRRDRISKTKQLRNRKSITLRQSHVDSILACLETAKKTYSTLPVHERGKLEKPTRQRICQHYFEQHTEELKELQITSPRTLENLCSRKVSKKQADHIRRQQNSIQASSPIDEPDLYSELNIRIGS